MECLECNVGKMQVPKDDHPSYFICDSCGAIELRYKPQDYQVPMHSVPYTTTDGVIDLQIIFVAGGYGSGKSRATLSEFLLRALENPNGTGLFTANTLQQLKRTTLKTFFNEVCPPPLIENYNKSDGEIKLINGFTIFTIASDEEEKLRSINAGVCHMEEASGIKRTIYDQLLTRLRDPFVKNRAFFVCTNPDLGYVKDVFVDNEKRKDPKHPQHEDYNPFIHTFIWPTKLNKFLPPDFIEMNSRGKPAWWRARFLEGSFEHSEGMVYPNIPRCFIESSEYVKQFEGNNRYKLDKYGIPTEWDRFVTMDHGIRNPTAVYFHAIDPEKCEVVTYNEYYEPNRVVPEHAKHIKPLMEEIPLGKLYFMVADPSTKNRTDPIEGKSVQSLYQEYGIYWSMGNNSLDAGILKVNSYIERGKWKIISDRCQNLCKEAINYKYPEVSMDDFNKNLDEKPVKAHDHGMDSIRYGFMRLPDDPNNLRTLSYSEPTRYTRSSIREEYEESAYIEGKSWEEFGY